MKRESWLKLLCGLIALILASACGAPAAAPTSAPAPMQAPAVETRPPEMATSPVRSELRLLTWYTGGSAEQSVYQRCGVSPEVVSWSDYPNKLMTMVDSGDAPDLIVMDTSQIASFAGKGILTPIADTAGVSLGDFLGPLVDAFTVAGQTYAVPRDFSTLALFYNTDLFDKAGLPYPTNDWTWGDLQSAAESITNATGVPGLYAPDGAWNFAPFVVQSGGRIMSPDFSDTWIDSQEAIAAGNFLADAVSKGWATTLEKLGGTPPYAAFGENKVAMMLAPYGWVNIFAQYPQLKYGVVDPPAGPGGEGTVLLASAYAVPAGAKDLQRSMEAIACLTSEESQSQLLESGEVLPSRQSLQSHAYLQNNPIAGTFFNGINLPTLPYNWGPRHGEVEGIIGQALGRVYQGKQTAEQSFQQAASEIRAPVKQ